MNHAAQNGPDPRDSSAADANARRRLLKLVAGGVPLMSGPPAIASAVAGSSAYRAALNDGRRPLPALVTTMADTWIRQPVQIVRIGPDGLTRAGGANVHTAFKVVTGRRARYYSTTAPHARIDCSGPPELKDSVDEPATQVMMLVLFDKQNFSMIPEVVDPTLYGQGSLQGLHCSSWSSIYPNARVRPLSCSGV